MTTPQVSTPSVDHPSQHDRPRQLRRSRQDRVFGGVCGGLGHYFGVDAVILRIAFVALTLAGGSGVLLYIVAWIVIPEVGTDDDTAVATHGSIAASHTLLGGLLVVAGILLLLSHAGLLAAPWPAMPALLLVLAGGAVAVEGLRGKWNGGLVGLAVVLAVIAAVTTMGTNAWHMTAGGIGDRMYAPESVADVREQYELGAGSFGLDLRQLQLSEGTTPVAVDVGMGEIEIRVPEGVAVDVTANSGTGEIVLFGEQEGGLGVDRSYTTPGYADAVARLDLDLSIGMGRIEVTR